MSLSIITNVASLGAQIQLRKTQDRLQQNIGRLSSGLRINRAGDDAAGLGISEQLKADIRGLGQARRNASDAISMVQVMEGGLNEIHGIVSRMRELAVQAANGTLGSTERSYIDTEYDQLQCEIDRIADVTEFNGTFLLNAAASVVFQVGINGNAADRTILQITNQNTTNLGISTVDLSTSAGAQSALTLFDAAITSLSTSRANIGAVQNRLGITINNLSTSHENLSAANSRIRDVDVAQESGDMVRNQILSQAGVSMLSQANQLPAAALSLLGG